MGVPPLDTPHLLGGIIVDAMSIVSSGVVGYKLYEAQDDILIISLVYKSLESKLGVQTYVPGFLCFVLAYLFFGSLLCRLSLLVEVGSLSELRGFAVPEVVRMFRRRIKEEPPFPWTVAIEKNRAKKMGRSYDERVFYAEEDLNLDDIEGAESTVVDEDRFRYVEDEEETVGHGGDEDKVRSLLRKAMNKDEAE